MQTAPAHRLANVAAVEMDAADVLAYLHATGVRFNAADKVEEAETFTNRRNGGSLSIPSKLYGTAQLQDRLRAFAPVAAAGPRFRPCTVTVTETPDGPAVLVSDEETGTALGLIQRKHAGWLAPLFDFGARVYVLAVTGGEGEKFYGVNVLFAGVADAIRSMNRAADVEALEAMMEEAYASGDPSRVSAAARLLALTGATYAPDPAEVGGDGAAEAGTFALCACGEVIPPNATTCAECAAEAAPVARQCDGRGRFLHVEATA